METKIMPQVYDINAQPIANVSAYKVRCEYLFNQAIQALPYVTIQASKDYKYHGTGIYSTNGTRIEFSLIDWLE
jgi:hypothetical protein